MKKQHQELYRQKLQQEQQDMEKEIKRMSENQLDGSMDEVISELSAYDNHPADLGSELFERSKDLALRQGLKHNLNRVNDALKRIETEEYGYCEQCGKIIDADRLAVMPATTLCKACKEKQEDDHDRQVRPIEEEVVAMPFGNLNNTGVNQIMFDGEDAWQQVAQYGTAETPQDIPNMIDYKHMMVDGDEDQGNVVDVDAIPYFVGADGTIYQDTYGQNDENSPGEVIIGDEEDND